MLAGEKDSALSAVEQALPWLEEEGTWWIEEKKCVSCHHSAFFVWAKDLALEAGIAVDEPTLDEQREWVWTSMLTVKKAEPDSGGEDRVNGDLNVEGVSQLLLSPSMSHVPDETKAQLLEIVRNGRGESGSWKANGQLPRQKRPPAETEAVSTRWALAALGEAPDAGPDDVKPAVSTEWYAIDSLLTDDVATLVTRQNEDGGWSWKNGEESDPMATGQALFALGRSTDRSSFNNAMEKGRAFLTRTQDAKGFWVTKSTKDRSESTRISNFFGTAWAIIGLLESIRQGEIEQG
jgi:rhamnogalacturonyl hydrolase YesR